MLNITNMLTQTVAERYYCFWLLQANQFFCRRQAEFHSGMHCIRHGRKHALKS